MAPSGVERARHEVAVEARWRRRLPVPKAPAQDDGVVIHREGEIPGPAGWSPALSTAAAPYAVAEVGVDALLYFLTLLRRDLRRKRLWPYDPVSYARDIRLPKSKLL